MTDRETVVYLGCRITVWPNGIVAETPDGDVEGFGSMAAARLWVRRWRRLMVAA